MKVIFCGNPDFAVPALNALLASQHQVQLVITSPDRPHGRGQKLLPLSVKQRAIESGLPILQPESLKDSEFLDSVRSLCPDALVVVAFRILPQDFFQIPRLGAFNIHPSLLPRGRGPAPIRWTLINGETETGVTIIQLSEIIDGGCIFAQERISVLPIDDYGMLHNRLAVLGAQLLIKVLDAFDSGCSPIPLVQVEQRATRAPKLSPADYELDWTLPANDLICRIRAFRPEPGAATGWNQTRIKILDAAKIESALSLPPSVIQNSSDQIFVGTGDGILELKTVKPEGKRVMSVAEFLRGRPTIPARFTKKEDRS